MNAVSTLCATSTVGIAACGYVLATPYYDENDHHLTNPRTSSNTSRPPLTRLPGTHYSIEATSRQCSNPSLYGASNSSESRPSTSRKWLRRLSESFSSAPGSILYTSSPSSVAVSSAGSRSPSLSIARTGSRPPTRNKLVKRSPSQRLSNRANSPLPPRHSRRPSTAIVQPTDQPNPTTTSHLLPNPIVSRPSTSAFEHAYFRPQNPELVDSWRQFFPAKRQKNTDDFAAKSSKAANRRRIVPDLLRRRWGPTLVIAPVVDIEMYHQSVGGEDEAISLYSDCGSLYPQSRPVSQHMGDSQNHRSRPPLSSGVSQNKRNVRRSFSLSNFLSGPTPKTSSGAKHNDDDTVANGFVGICSMGVGFGRRYSTSLPSDARPSYPYQHRTRPITPAFEDAFEDLPNDPLPTIQSLSMLELSLEEPPSGTPGPPADNQDRPPSSRSSPAPISEITGLPPRPHRLSIRSNSERASTLVGSESEREFGSDTLFDSVRTRISELTPVRVDSRSLFDYEDVTPKCENRSPLQMKLGQNMSESAFTPIKGFSNMESSPNSARTTRALVTKISFDDDDDGWSSDWDIPSRSGDGESHRLSAPGGLRPYSGVLSGSLLGLSANSNTSNTSFGTAPEALSVDGSSMRETNSILDWNDGVSVATTSTVGNGYRPKTVHAKESVLNGSRAGRRAPTFHVRSQSVPVGNGLRGRVPLPSENWDDDFLDEDDENATGIYQSEIVIPRVIEERQASIIGHLGCVREFALLVEDLKRLRDAAIASNIRDTTEQHLWNEVDGIIALASVDDDEEDAPLRKERLHRQNTWSPSGRQDRSDVSDQRSSSHRRSVVLHPGDDIFGGNGSTSSGTPTSQRHQGHYSASPSPQSKKIIDKNDPIEVAKSMMEKMQQRHRADHLTAASRASTDLPSGRVPFDTDMLKDLVVHVGQLKRELTTVINELPSNPDPVLRLTTKLRDGPIDDRFGFDISPITTSIDETLGNGYEGVKTSGMDFRPIIRIA